MSELATLRRLRAANAKLMKSNLALLTSIRQTDCEIEDEWRELQQCCVLLEQRGLAIPTSCLALMGTATNDANADDQTEQGDSADEAMQQDAGDASASNRHNKEKPPQHPAASVLSVRSVLNDDEPSESDDDQNDSIEDSTSDRGSADDQ